MWQYEIVVSAEQALVYVREHHKEPSLFQFHIGIQVHQRIVSYLDFALVVETQGSRLVRVAVIAGEVLAIDAELYVQHPCDAEQQVHVALQTEIGQRDNTGFAALLIYQFVVEVEYAEFEILVQLGRKDLYDVALLLGEGILI